MTKKSFLFLGAMLGICASISAQNPHIPTTAGTELKYILEDADGKHAGYRRIVVTSAEQTPDGLMLKSITTNYGTDDKPMEKQAIMEYTILVTDKDVIYLKSGMIPRLKMLENMDIEIEGDDVVYPIDFVPGQVFPTAEMTAYNVKEKTNKTKSQKLMDIYYENRSAGDRETVTVPYGTFDAMTLTESLRFKALGGLAGRDQTTKKWFVPGIGQVQAEQYDKRGNVVTKAKLVSVTILPQ